MASRLRSIARRRPGHGLSVRLLVGLASAGALSILPACIDHGGGVVSVEASTSGTTLPSTSRTRPAEGPGLHNLVAFHDGLVSGGVPEGDEAFALVTATCCPSKLCTVPAWSKSLHVSTHTR